MHHARHGGRDSRTPRTITTTIVALTILSACTPPQPPPRVPPGPEADVAFREALDEALPGVFTDDEPGMIPASFHARLTCGAMLPPKDRPGADASHSRAEIIDVWAEDLGPGRAETFVDVAIEHLCPGAGRGA
ncbi:DUF732 domain-containing protein [Serinibacter arcticus]|nr:hypothetical protein [Serinibacter arcticus]